MQANHADLRIVQGIASKYYDLNISAHGALMRTPSPTAPIGSAEASAPTQRQTRFLMNPPADGLKIADAVLAKVEPLLANENAKHAVNPALTVVGKIAFGKIAEQVVKEGAKYAIGPSIGDVPAKIVAETLGEVTKEVISLIFEHMKDQSASDKKLDILLKQPLSKAQQLIYQVLSNDWKTDANKTERDRRLKLAHDELSGALNNLEDRPELHAFVQRLIMLTDALLPDSRPALDGSLKLLRYEAAAKMGQAAPWESIFAGRVRRLLVRSAIPKLASAPISSVASTTPLVVQNSTPPQPFYADSLRMRYEDMGYLRWTILPMLGALAGVPGLVAGVLITSLIQYRQIRNVLVNYNTVEADARIRAKELRESADRLYRFCDLVEWIANNTEEFFRVARQTMLQAPAYSRI